MMTEDNQRCFVESKPYWGWVRAGITILLGMVMVWAAVYKAYVPESAEQLLGVAAPALPTVLTIRAIILGEWVLGVALLAGVRTRIALSAFIVALSLFSTILFRAKVMGFSGNCGCLGLSGTVSDALVRNGVLVSVAVMGYFAPNAGARSESFIAKE